MKLYNQTNIKNNIIYFPLWRIKPNKHYVPWTWESRYLCLVTNITMDRWAHNCRVLGAISLDNKIDACAFCGAIRDNEPSDDAVYDYMEIEYD